MELKQTSKWIVITGTLVIWIIKFIIRPLHLVDDPARFFFNIAPNLLGSFLMLVVNEYLQLIPFFGRTFDYNDILFSSVGLFVSYFVFSRIQSRKRRDYQVQVD